MDRPKLDFPRRSDTKLKRGYEDIVSPPGGVAIHSRCLIAVVTLVLAGVAATPLATAQIPEPAPPFTLAADRNTTEVAPGAVATFTLTVGNGALFDRGAQMNVTSAHPPGWLFNFTPDPVPVARQNTSTTTLTVFVPDDAAPQSQTLAVEADDAFSTWTRLNLTVVVRGPPEPTTTVDSPPQPRGPPTVSLGVAGGEPAPEGGRIEGTITLLHNDAAYHDNRLAAAVSVRAPAGWQASIPPSGEFRSLVYGVVHTIPVSVVVPDLAEDTNADVVVTVTIDGRSTTAVWRVSGLTAGSSSASAPAEPAAGSGPASEAPVVRPASAGPNFQILVKPLELPVESGGSASALVEIENTGGSSLDVDLHATAPGTWRPPTLGTSAVSLSPGEKRIVELTILAPDGIPSGGRAEVVLMGTSESGLVRNAKLVLHTVEPSTPLESPSPSRAAAVETPAAPEGSPLPSVGPAALVAVGLAAAGSVGLVLVSRPMREKLLWGAAGLYTRLARPDVLGHEDRERLYRLVETQPGIHFHALQRDLAWNTGTLTYHLRVLERHGFVVSRRDGLYRRFYLSGAAPRKETFENAGPTGLRADVLEAVRNTPGISQSDLALGLGANKQTVNYHVKALERGGTIRVEKRGRDTYLFPADAQAQPDADAARA